jgi:hypothetical protein
MQQSRKNLLAEIERLFKFVISNFVECGDGLVVKHKMSVILFSIRP